MNRCSKLLCSMTAATLVAASGIGLTQEPSAPKGALSDGTFYLPSPSQTLTSSTKNSGNTYLVRSSSAMKPLLGSQQSAPQAVASSSSWENSYNNGSDKIGSTNVPMDSWIYPALERLSSMGLVPFQSVAIRPWTRQECRRQVQQAKDILSGIRGSYYAVNDGIMNEAERLIPQLDQELSEPNESSQAVLESGYMRVGTIAGPALSDGFHIGQTWTNDFGRPLGRGTSTIAGYSFRAVHGRFFFYDRQELQQTPTIPATTAALSALYFSLDDFGTKESAPPYPITTASPSYVRQRPLELYAGVAFDGYSLSFGKQELFWGPTTMGPLSFSSNAEPTYNLRLVATRPHPFPFVPSLGSYRIDAVFGKLSGHHYPARPYFNGLKVDFNFGRLLEMSFTRWSILFGEGHPMTLGNLKHNLFSGTSTGTDFGYGDREDPGDRKSAFDFRLHVPGLRNYVTIYTDAYADDELSPLNAPRRVVWHPGIYFARLPLLPHMDLRVEAASSEEMSQDETGRRFFINNQYRDGNTNKGFLLGNAVGRDARSLEARSGYWFSAKTRVEIGYRQTKGGLLYLPGGSTISDGFMTASYAFTPQWSTQVFTQYERFLIPSYMPGAQHNTSGRLQITWNPKISLFSKH
ncbi:capsule assembly Wzi family protein [Terriglobus saanensis]|uniref:Capsule assembly protein Wzi n=1 Tax=Terriglobus saanensis (strain ATCC BAA-1853 / DSM 23119 / SP1PR4) TaxID=401053 RepID=E8V350_TERSS|nr:capsule assembly Wzi family protein [Terriglobus saanensis]ADV81325.1 hypothetical protein AciPR4_0490 [Terriglobus saanensis SP1PR4]